MASDVLSVESDGRVATVWLDDPERANALGPAFFADLPAVFDELAADQSVRAVVVAARGGAFTVGLDLKAMGGVLAGQPGSGTAGGGDGASGALSRAGLLCTLRNMQAAFTRVAECPKPVVAAVHGWCLGGGVDLATACDIRVASADAVFSVRETRMAMVADLGTLQRLPLIVGRGHAAEMAFTGADVDAERAAQIGLVNRVMPDAASAVEEAQRVAESIAANSPLAVIGVKAVLRRAERQAEAEGLDYVGVWNAAFLRSRDLNEAVGAFLEKRPSDFRGE